MFSLEQGRLHRDGQPFFSVGFNYHPADTGCYYWQRWDPARIEADLRGMAARGFNTVRFFLFWADFEPEPGRYDAEKVAHLVEFVSIARRQGICCIPALLTIWMNGQRFDLPWRAGRDLWSDPELVARERDYVAHIAAALRDADNILAYDLGDEVIHVDFAASSRLTRAEAAAWQRGLAAAIRGAHPGALVIQGNEASSVLGFHAFRPDNSQALDMIAVHGFSVWSPFAIESIASYKSTIYVSFLVQFARAFGAPFIDELGCYGGDEEIAAAYMRATAHSLLANGANGTVVWCWQDFTTTEKPYALRPSERFVGFVDAQGRAKPALESFAAFATPARESWAGLQIPPAPVGVYIPDQYNVADGSYIQASASSAPALFYAFVLLKRAHLPFEFTRGPLDRYRLVISPSVHQLTLRDQLLLSDYVAGGGTLYYSPGDYLHGFGGEELFGVRLRDFTLSADAMGSFAWAGQTYPLHWGGHGGETQIPIVRATTAEVLATFPNGSPALTRQRYGQGVAYYLNAPFEQQLNLPFRLDNVPWHMVYDKLAQAAGVQRDLDVDSPDVELALLADRQQRYAFIINHAADPVELRLSRADTARAELLRLEGKDVRVIVWPAANQ